MTGNAGTTTKGGPGDTGEKHQMPRSQQLTPGPSSEFTMSNS
jgi:hypothetical protein